MFIYQKISKGPGAPVFIEGGGRLCHGTMAQWPVKACFQAIMHTEYVNICVYASQPNRPNGEHGMRDMTLMCRLLSELRRLQNADVCDQQKKTDIENQKYR